MKLPLRHLKYLLFLITLNYFATEKKNPTVHDILRITLIKNFSMFSTC